MSDYEEIPPPGFEWIACFNSKSLRCFYFLGVIRIAIPNLLSRIESTGRSHNNLQLLYVWFTATGWGSIPFARVDRWFGGSYST